MWMRLYHHIKSNFLENVNFNTHWTYKGHNDAKHTKTANQNYFGIWKDKILLRTTELRLYVTEFTASLSCHKMSLRKLRVDNFKNKKSETEHSYLLLKIRKDTGETFFLY